MTTKIKAYCSQLTMHYGTATITGGLYPIRAVSQRPDYKLCTPDGTPVEQVYRDEDGKVWSKDQLERYVEEGGERKIVSDDAVAKAKESSLPKNIINLTAHPRDDVERFVFPSTNQAYVFKPVLKVKGKEIKDPVNVQWYDFLNVVLRDSNLALMGLCNLQNHEGLFRLGLYQGWITMQKQLYPEELNQYETYTPNLDDVVRRKAVDKSRDTKVEFDSSKYIDVVKERLINLDPSKADSNAQPIAPVPTEIDMFAALDSFGV